MSQTLLRQYALLGLVLAGFVALLWAIASAPPAEIPQEPRQLVQPVIALIALTAVVWLLMFAFRNVAVARGLAKLNYYRTYTGDEPPPEWVERPARTFMNLLEIPVLFYLVCVLMLQTAQWDSVQVSLAWLFVGTRYLHAFVYIGFNHVPMRLAAYLMGCLTLGVMWVRFGTPFV